MKSGKRFRLERRAFSAAPYTFHRQANELNGKCSLIFYGDVLNDPEPPPIPVKENFGKTTWPSMNLAEYLIENLLERTSPASMNLSKSMAFYMKKGSRTLPERVSREAYFIAETTALTNRRVYCVNKPSFQAHGKNEILLFHARAVTGKMVAENRGG